MKYKLEYIFIGLVIVGFLVGYLFAQIPPYHDRSKGKASALILGCIVIVKKSVLDPLYIDLPVLIIDEWTDITDELLQNTSNIYKSRIFNYDKLTMKYWIKKIHELIND
jgi:hypothetical protein